MCVFYDAQNRQWAQHQTAGRCEEYAMDMHCVYGQNQILKQYFDECETLKGSVLNRTVW
jgi:hypothetical protein